MGKPDEPDDAAKAKVLACFQSWDENRDGVICQAELRTALTCIGFPKSKVSSLFRAMDADKNDKVEFPEFVEWVFTPATTSQKMDLVKILKSSSEASVAEMACNYKRPFDIM